MESLDSNYNGEDLRFFGAIYVPGGGYARGGSKNTLVYKKAVQFLLEKNLISETDTHRAFVPGNDNPSNSYSTVKTIPCPKTPSHSSSVSISSNNPFEKDTDSNSHKSHRKLFIILGIIFVILLIVL